MHPHLLEFELMPHENVVATLEVVDWSPSAGLVAISDHGRILVALAAPGSAITRTYTNDAVLVPWGTDLSETVVLAEEGGALVLHTQASLEERWRFATMLAVARS